MVKFQLEIDEMPDSHIEAFLMGALNSATRGELDGGQSRLEGRLDAAMKAVKLTGKRLRTLRSSMASPNTFQPSESSK